MGSVYVRITHLLWGFLLSLPVLASIHDRQQWIFKNGEGVELQFVNAYGPTAYFLNGSNSVYVDIHNFAEAEQAEIVLWSRERDEGIQNGSLPLTDFTKRFRSDARRLVDGKLVKPNWTDIKEPDFYAIYTSASWCGPCREFTPRLVAGYDSGKGLYGDRFEVLLCSWDKTSGKMKNYMKENGMSWFGTWDDRNDRFWRKYQSKGIPCLVIVDRSGYILSHSYNAEGYLGPSVPLMKLYKLLTHTIERPAGRLSVPTPGIDTNKLSELIQQERRQVEDSGKDSGPFPLIQPVGLLQEIEDPKAEKVLFKVKVYLDSTGVVRSTKLLSHENEKLASVFNRMFALWQFMPKITVAEGPVPCEVILPVSLSVNL